MQIHINSQTFILSPTRTLFWKEKRWLIISDAHFAKESHFRKNGIAVPSGILQTDLKKIDFLINEFKPSEIIFLGDMFHSEENEGLHEFLQWRKKLKSVSIQLVIGNHDILNREWYVFAGIKTSESYLQSENLIFSHEQIIVDDENLYNFSGHIHPCIVMHGKAKQSLRLPCFWFGERGGILPAFGTFTGARRIRPDKNDKIYAIAEKEIICLQ